MYLRVSRSSRPTRPDDHISTGAAHFVCTDRWHGRSAALLGSHFERLNKETIVIYCPGVFDAAAAGGAWMASESDDRAEPAP